MEALPELLILCALLHTASPLKCLACTADDWASCLEAETTCEASVTSCVSAISTVLTGGGNRVTKVFRSCYPTALCDQPVSFNVTTSSGHVSLKCCQTDSCNTEDVTASEDRPSAKLECYGSFIAKNKCRSKVKCSASQDHCLKIGTKGRKEDGVKGCVSKSLCEVDSPASWFIQGSLTGRRFCCKTKDCNSGEPLDQSSLLMLIPLTAFLF
ncbi:urokinase plasminogen activator surface receptor-like [Polyodon spathula]|uniref:urokinase plasminogen activator surface receptor-like n=1 Tax=Polyodon spathula TaxID=7913 RepID=UPI001B7EA063|nr:urokinase plasminogen activator surface receptor-like [Polyodon spathula]